MADKNESPELDAFFQQQAEAAGPGFFGPHTGPVEEPEIAEPEPAEPAEDPQPDPVAEQPKGKDWQKLAGDRANEIGDLRQALREAGEAGQAKLREIYGQDPREARAPQEEPEVRGNTPEDQLFHKYWMHADPDYERNVEDPYESQRMRAAFNMARLALGSMIPQMQQLQQAISADREVAMLSEYGVSPEAVAAVTQNPTLAGLWARANFEERLELLKAAGATGERPAQRGASSRPEMVPGQHIESAGGGSSQPATMTPGTPRLEQVQDLIDQGKSSDPLVQDTIDDILNQSLTRVRGAVINPNHLKGRRRARR